MKLLNFLSLFLFPLAALSAPATGHVREALFDDQPAIAAFDAQVLALVKKEDLPALEAFGEGLRDPGKHWPSSAPMIDRFFYVLGMETLVQPREEKDWLSRQAILERWAKMSPQKPMPALALAEFWYEYAWEARGGGFSNSVTNEGRRLFKSRLARSETWLDRAASLKADESFPYYYQVLICLQNSQNKDKEELIESYEACRKRFPAYFQITESLVWGLLPRWGGEWELRTSFRKELDRDPLAAVWGVARRMNRIAEDSNGFTWVLLGYPTKDALWATLEYGISKIDTAYPKSVQNLNLFVILADKMGRPEKAAKWMRRLDGRMDADLWKFKSYPDRFWELDKMFRGDHRDL